LQFLDDNVLPVPALALDALEREIGRVGHVASRMARSVLAGADLARVAEDQRIATRLDAAIEHFVERMHRAQMGKATSERLAWALRVLRYQQTASEQAFAAGQLLPWMAAAGTDLAQAQTHFAQHADALFGLCDPQQGGPSSGMTAAALDAVEQSYQALKAALLVAGADGQLPMAAMEQTLSRYSALRRAAQQQAKATSPIRHPTGLGT
jgi:phosphate:Na+ symporter